MPGRVQKLLVGVASFLIVSGLLWTTNFFYQKTQIVQPFLQKIGGIDGVEQLELSTDKGEVVVNLTLSPDGDITTIWPQIMEAAATIDDPGRFAFRICESKELPAELEKAAVILELAVQESVATGAYTTIPKVLAELETEYGIASQVSLSREQLLIELAAGSDKTYQIVSLAQMGKG
ncbi:MAG: hypothetical protein GX058_07910 [Firmicutes bacterium]|nr:hypothetical protein [Bacillota bacterium]